MSDAQPAKMLYAQRVQHTIRNCCCNNFHVWTKYNVCFHTSRKSIGAHLKAVECWMAGWRAESLHSQTKRNVHWPNKTTSNQEQNNNNNDDGTVWLKKHTRFLIVNVHEMVNVQPIGWVVRVPWVRPATDSWKNKTHRGKHKTYIQCVMRNINSQASRLEWMYTHCKHTARA